MIGSALVLTMSMALANPAMAGSGSKSITNQSDNNSIVTPDVARGFYSTSRFNHDVNGDLVICRNPASFDWLDRTCTYAGKSAWTHVLNTIPAGRTYVGFRPAYVGSTSLIEVYWK